MKRVYLYTHDPMLTMLYTKEEVLDLFGQDYLDDYGVDIDDNLHDEFIKAKLKFFELCDQLRKIESGNR